MSISLNSGPEITVQFAQMPEGLLGAMAAQAAQVEQLDLGARSRITSLTDTALAMGSVVEVVGIPAYVDDVAPYAAYGLTLPGWYVFARIAARGGASVTAGTVVTGAAGYIAAVGADHVDVAVKFDVAAMAQAVSVAWGDYTDTYVFRATDLAVRNLDYRTTFYVYDIAPFTRWEYAPTTDATFAAGKNYFVRSGEGFEPAEVETVAYALTADETFQASKTYYVVEGGEYVAATVTAGEAVTADTYYEQTTVPVPAIYYEDRYALTADETFADGKTYYTESGGEYAAAEVTPGEAVTADNYYEHAYALTEDATFQTGKAYYTLSGTTYSAAEVTAGAALPTVYYVHSKAIFEGMTRNITYVCNEIIDCPSEFILPEIEDETHGCWFEIRFRHAGSYSSTLVPPEDVKVATEHTQAETAGINMVDLHYTSVNGVRMWRFMNTHSTIPT